MKQVPAAARIVANILGATVVLAPRTPTTTLLDGNAVAPGSSDHLWEISVVALWGEVIGDDLGSVAVQSPENAVLARPAVRIGKGRAIARTVERLPVAPAVRLQVAGAGEYIEADPIVATCGCFWIGWCTVAPTTLLAT